MRSVRVVAGIHGGDVALQSVLATGTTVTVRLPLSLMREETQP